MRHSATWVLLAGCLAAVPCAAQAGDAAAPDAGPVAPVADGGAAPVMVAMLSFESNKAAAEAAPAVSSLVASQLAESKALRLISDKDVAAAIGRDRQKQLLGGCSDASCMAELSGALGARYLVVGRLDRLGGSYVLTASLFDSQRGVSVAKPRAEAADDDALRGAATQVAAQLLEVLAGPEAGRAAAAELAAADGSGFTLGVKLGNQFLASLAALNPGAELELGLALDPEWLAFLQVGFNFVRGESAGKEVSLTVVPSVIGVRRLYRTLHSLQPFWGLGLGLQLSFGHFGPFSETDSFPTVIGMFGTQYKVTGRLSALAEASINFTQLVLGLRYRDNGLGSGLNFDLSLGMLYRF